MTLQVLVAGAGPVGLTMAAELARYGVAVRIVDKAARRTDKSKALVLWSRTLELLDRAAPSAAFITAGRKVVAANIIAGNTQIAHISLTSVESPYPFALMLPQAETERLLEAHLLSLGISVEREVEVVGFAEAANGVTTVLRHADGHEESVASEWLSGCDGAHSTVRHGLGLSFLGETLLSDWILADAHVSGAPLSESQLGIYWHEDGVLALFPISAGRFRVIADSGDARGGPPADPTLEQVQAVVDRRGPEGLVVSDPIWLSAFRINERKVKDYRVGRVFIAGDAAHVHSPAGGQGMNTGMQDAFNLAWKLALVCNGSCVAHELLDSYSAERSAVGDEVMANASRLTAVAVMKNHTAQTLRNFLGGILFGLAPVRRAMADDFAEISIGYARSPINGPGAQGLSAPGPGERMPLASGLNPVGAGAAPRFALFATADEATARLLSDFEDILEPGVRAPPRAGGMWLVRPDGYTACVAKAGNLRTLADYLHRLQGSVA